jgi:hypothetical protein
MSEPGQGMLSLVACISLPVLAAWVIFSYVSSSRESILAKRLPRLRPTLRVWAVVIAILAIDFAANSLCNRYPGLVVRLDACDTVIILLSALEMMFCQASARDLWAQAFAVGLLGMHVMF